MAWNTFDWMPVTLAQAEDPRPDAEAAPGAPSTEGVEGTEGGAEDGALGQGNNTDTGGGSPFGGNMMLIFLLVLVVMWIFLMGGQRKEKKKRAALLAAVSKGAKVQTVGGILGTVVEVRDDELVVKVDENSNTRMRFSRSAIQNVITDEEA